MTATALTVGTAALLSRTIELNRMSSEFNERLPESLGERTQVWIIGTREQVNHIISEMYVKEMIRDRSEFSPMVPVPFTPGKFMSVLLR